MRDSHRALRTVLHVIHRQLQLGLLSDVGVLEEGNTAQEDGVTGALCRKAETEKEGTVSNTVNQRKLSYESIGYKGKPKSLSKDKCNKLVYLLERQYAKMLSLFEACL